MAQRTPRTTGGGAGVGNPGPDIGPEQKPDVKHDGAPAGEFFGNDLPVDPLPSGGTPATTGGYRPDQGNPPLGTPGDPSGAQKPPSGRRR